MARYKTIIVMLLTLVFAGQVLASTILSCQSHSPETVVSANSVDHSQHMSMDTPFADAAFSVDCCGNGDCNLGGCTLTAVLPLAQSLLLAGLASSPGQYHELALNQRTSPLLRPPISA